MASVLFLKMVGEANFSAFHTLLLLLLENTALRVKALKPYVAVKTEAIMIHMDFARGLGASSLSQEDLFVSLQQWHLEAVSLPLLTIVSHQGQLGWGSGWD